MFFYNETDLETPPQETIPAGTISIDEGLYLFSEENQYIILE